MKRLGRDVIAVRNWYQQDDDFFTQVLILKNGECWRLRQGLQVVNAYRFKAPTRKFQRLKMLLASIPAAWPPSSYEGYNFITDAKGPRASEIAVYGKRWGDP